MIVDWLVKNEVSYEWYISMALLYSRPKMLVSRWISLALIIVTIKCCKKLIQARIFQTDPIVKCDSGSFVVLEPRNYNHRNTTKDKVGIFSYFDNLEP